MSEELEFMKEQLENGMKILDLIKNEDSDLGSIMNSAISQLTGSLKGETCLAMLNDLTKVIHEDLIRKEIYDKVIHEDLIRKEIYDKVISHGGWDDHEDFLRTCLFYIIRLRFISAVEGEVKFLERMIVERGF